MYISKDVTIGEQTGMVEVDDTQNVKVNLTTLKGSLTLNELEGLLKTARDLNRRVNPNPECPVHGKK
jgi:hypothetical protein